MLVTERPGRLQVIRDGKLDPRPIGGVPEVLAIQLAGLMDVALDPKFSDNHLVYLTYNKPGENKRVATPQARGRLEGNDLTGVRDIFLADWLPENSNGYNSRLAFGRDGMIYVSNGASNSDSAQDPKQYSRKDHAAARRRQRTTRQSLRRPRRVEAGDLFHGPSQYLGTHCASRDGRAVEQRKRSQWGRRNQYYPAGQELRLASGQLWALVRRAARFRGPVAGGL
jgi:glucose/arabinose dehydrogenase